MEVDLFKLITARSATEADDFEPPSYSEPGKILFHYKNPLSDDEVEIIDYDGGGPFWLNEGGFMDYTVRDMIDLELEGQYVLEGVLGTYIRGDGYVTDDWETYEFEFCRRASQQEIDTGALT